MKNLQNEEYWKAFGRQLRKLREEKGIGKREFALIADMEYSQLAKIERGAANATLSTILLLSNALNVPHSELLNFKFPRQKGK